MHEGRAANREPGVLMLLLLAKAMKSSLVS